MCALNLVFRCLASFALLLVWVAVPGQALGEPKFNPGHYIQIMSSDTDPDAIANVSRNGVAGVIKRYYWRDLEPQPGVYDFSQISSDLTKASATGRQLVVFVLDKTFKNERPTPPDMWSNYTLPIRQVEPGEGWVSMRWDPYVANRMGTLGRQIGLAFDSHPRFEGIAYQESALGVVKTLRDANGYTPEKYRDAIISVLTQTASALDESRVFWYMNFLSGRNGYLLDVIDAVAGMPVAVGGPDILPENDSLNTHVYPKIRNLDAQVVRFNSAQHESFKHIHSASDAVTKYWTPQEIFDFGRDSLGLDYVFWNRVRWPNPNDSYTIEDAYPVMAEHPQFSRRDDSSIPKPPTIIATN